MRIFLLVILLTGFLTSCSRYQYVTIAGSNIRKNDKQEFVIENDSIRIQYNFNGADAPINITIENKLDVPLYVDWQQSALIINTKAISYVPNTVPIEGVFNGSTVSWNPGGYSNSSGAIDAKAILPDKFDFVPPRSYIIKNPMGVTNLFISDVPDSVFHQERVRLGDGSLAVIKHAVFAETFSPLQFKNYVTLIFGEKHAKTIAYPHSFYISEIYTTGLDPETFWIGTQYRGNQYYVKETTGFGKGFGVVAGVALLTTAAALEQKNVNKAKQ